MFSIKTHKDMTSYFHYVHISSIFVMQDDDVPDVKLTVTFEKLF